MEVRSAVATAERCLDEVCLICVPSQALKYLEFALPLATSVWMCEWYGWWVTYKLQLLQQKAVDTDRLRSDAEALSIDAEVEEEMLKEVSAVKALSTTGC